MRVDQCRRSFEASLSEGKSLFVRNYIVGKDFQNQFVNNLNKVSDLYFLSDDWSKLFSYVIERIRVCDKEQWALWGDQRWTPLLTFTILFLPILVSNNPQPKEAYTDQNGYFYTFLRPKFSTRSAKLATLLCEMEGGRWLKAKKNISLCVNKIPLCTNWAQ